MQLFLVQGAEAIHDLRLLWLIEVLLQALGLLQFCQSALDGIEHILFDGLQVGFLYKSVEGIYGCGSDPGAIFSAEEAQALCDSGGLLVELSWQVFDGEDLVQGFGQLLFVELLAGRLVQQLLARGGILAVSQPGNVVAFEDTQAQGVA